MSKFKWFILCSLWATATSADALKCEGAFNTASSSRKWMSFDEAKALMQSQGIKTHKQFQEWSKSEQRPKDFPSNPQRTYRNEWRGWENFLGTESTSVRNKDWMGFDQAQTFIQSQGIKTITEFNEWKKAGKRPKDFPSHPDQIYQDKWTSWGDFLGTGNISNKKRDWMSFNQAKALMQNLGIKTNTEFNEWSKSEQRPKDFPSNPRRAYKNEWVSWKNFFGTESISTRKKKQWMSFEEAKALIQSQGIKTSTEFIEWSKSKQRPENFPSTPRRAYKNEWRGWGDFLGTGNTSTKSNGQSFEETNTLTQSRADRNHIKPKRKNRTSKRPKNTPRRSDQTDDKDEHTDQSDPLGTGNISTENNGQTSFEEIKAFLQRLGVRTYIESEEEEQVSIKPENFPSTSDEASRDTQTDLNGFSGSETTWMSFNEAKEYVRSLNFENSKDFIDWLKSSDRPENFPPNPQKAYSEWVSLKDFLSTKEYMTYEEAKTFVQQLGITNQRDFFEEKKNNSDIFPENFPPNPKAFYTNKGEWIDWNDFLGLTNKSHSKTNSSGENFQIEGGKLGQEDIFTDAEEGSKWGENVEI